GAHRVLHPGVSQPLGPWSPGTGPLCRRARRAGRQPRSHRSRRSDRSARQLTGILIAFDRASQSGMRAGRGRTVVITVIIAVLLAAGYTAYAANRVYHSLESGRRQLAAPHASLAAAARTGH